MGRLRLLVPDPARRESLATERVHMVGFDGLPWLTRSFWLEDQLVVERKESDSGLVHLPWHVGRYGEMSLVTATLRERPAPYLLPVELARGSLYRLRCHLDAGEHLGQRVPPAVYQQAADAVRLFSRSAGRQETPTEAAALAQQALELAVTANEQLAHAYADQVLTTRRQPQERLCTLLGVNLGETLPPPAVQSQLPGPFNLVSLPMAWRQIEPQQGSYHWQSIDQQLQWARSQQVKTIAGPLLQFDEQGVPDWTYLWEGNNETLTTLMIEQVTRVVKRYRGQVRIWHVAGRINRGRVLSLNEEQRLQITAAAVETVKQLDPPTPVIVSMNQPWGEYLATEPIDLAPIHFADALVRAEVGLTGLGLELNFGSGANATLPRSPLELSRLLDQWGFFDLPLAVLLSVESHLATSPGTVAHNWLRCYLPVILAKNHVQVVTWNQRQQAAATPPNHAGLFDREGQPTPEFNVLKQAHQQYWS